MKNQRVFCAKTCEFNVFEHVIEHRCSCVIEFIRLGAKQNLR